YTGRLNHSRNTLLGQPFRSSTQQHRNRVGVLPSRRVVERTFGWLTKHRCLVRDYENRPDHHEAMVYITAVRALTRQLARTTDQAI
ncbi:transposase, partial [Nocardia farcinica]